MAETDFRQDIHGLLQKFQGMKDLRDLFWTQLNYNRANDPLPTRAWRDTKGGQDALDALAEDPRLVASGGTGDDFHIIYTRLQGAGLSRAAERGIIERLLPDHPYALFVFSNQDQQQWHFVNVKLDGQAAKRRVFRRITVGPGEGLRTATERLSLLDLDAIPRDLFGKSPLAVQKAHDDAFDVEKVSKDFFREYRKVFEAVEASVVGFGDQTDRRRLFTQRLFNRLMFIAFIQKKGWLKFGTQTDYLSALWTAYGADKVADKNFYRDRLVPLFFAGLNTPNDVPVIEINRGGWLKTLIGDVPYLNGGLFEEDDDDRTPGLAIPDSALAAILGQLFARFNFTVTESTPLDIEVAVDPEMLGKVFEELVTGRHESGSYYTPKPVVAFMCREALKGYLAHRLPGESAAALAAFVDEHSPAGLRDPEAVLDALKTVTVCDPACGSGAYLLGMLHELLDLRAALFATRRVDAVSTYQRKLDIIQRNVYGVDLDPFAVNIARLRLWLSLAVDFEGATPEPLPNLDFKIEAGDSLTAPDPSAGLEMGFRKSLIDEYMRLKEAYLTAHGTEKRALKVQIDATRAAIRDLTHAGGVPGFDWAVEFAEVFARGGFDIIVANPPYVRHELITSLKPALQKVYPKVYKGTADLYVYFYGRALQLLRTGGMLAFISSNKWFRAAYGDRLREHIATTCRVFSITDFGDLPVFESATAYPMIFIAKQEANGHNEPIVTLVKSLEPPYPDVREVIKLQGQQLSSTALASSNWILADSSSASSVETMRVIGVPLREYISGKIYVGLKTGFNKAYWIDSNKRKELLARDPRSSEIIKPLAIGKDVRRWRLDQSDTWLIVTRIGVDIKRYPAIFDHLLQFKTRLEQRSDQGEHWWELRACAYYHAFDQPKIVFPDIALSSRFAFDTEGVYVDMTAFVIPEQDFYLLGILNSSSVASFFVEVGAQVRGGYLRFKRQYVEQIPIPKATSADRSVIEALVEKCLGAKGQGPEVAEWEAEINARVARLYGLPEPDLEQA